MIQRTLVALAALCSVGFAADPVSFVNDIQPILHERCWKCHGGDVQLSKLDLRTRESALRGGEHGAAIVPGKSAASRLYRLVSGEVKPSMPMDGALTAAEIAKIKDWIDQGASWEGATPIASLAPTSKASLENMEISPEARAYWAFQIPKRSPVPVEDGYSNPIDRFLEKARAEKGIHAAPRADPNTLVRRAYLDLIGLPPTPEQVAAFVGDKEPGAWDRLIEELLASPHYGERWGRHWLDVANYADSSGFEHDYDRPNAWRYRDYVIRSFQRDTPYNVFIQEQIAGDELDWRTNDSMIATGFLRNGARVGFREKDNPERRYDYLDDMIATIGRGVLGMTVQCARCHNHKFDPIPQKDYYSLEASLFGTVETTWPLLPRPQAEAYMRKMAEIDGKVEPLKAAIAEIEAPYRQKIAEQQVKRFPANIQAAVAKPAAERTPGEQLLVDQVLRSAISVSGRAIDQAMSPEDAARKKELAAQIAALEKQRPAPVAMADIVTDGDYRFAPNGDGDDVVSCPKCRVGEATDGSYLHLGAGKYEAPASYLLIRGDPFSKGSRMQPGFLTVATYGDPPTAIPPPDGHTSGRRRALAEWLTSPENPLTARVMVNRIWAHHLGRGIVASLDNFGKMGDRPTNQPLLDWLAVEFMNRGWSVKEMHRLIMTSDAYQMASADIDAKAAEADPQNNLLWRFRQQRLDAEVIRDQIMSVAGSIDLTVGGPPVFPYLPPEILKPVSTGIWKREEDGPKVWRRSVYVYRKRGLPFPLFQVFDLPDQTFSAAASRNVSTVPTQALTLLNNEFVLRQARLFAERVEKEAGARGVAAEIELAYRIALARAPTERELAIGTELVSSHSLVDLTHVLMNLNEFVYMR